MDHETNPHIEHLARDFITRAVGIVGLAGIALIHLLDSIGKFSETPYIAWMYIALMVGSVAVAGGLMHSRDRRLWIPARGERDHRLRPQPHGRAAQRDRRH